MGLYWPLNPTLCLGMYGGMLLYLPMIWMGIDIFFVSPVKGGSFDHYFGSWKWWTSCTQGGVWPVYVGVHDTHIRFKCIYLWGYLCSLTLCIWCACVFPQKHRKEENYQGSTGYRRKKQGSRSKNRGSDGKSGKQEKAKNSEDYTYGIMDLTAQYTNLEFIVCPNWFLKTSDEKDPNMKFWLMVEN